MSALDDFLRDVVADCVGARPAPVCALCGDADAGPWLTCRWCGVVLCEACEADHDKAHRETP